MYPRHVRDHIYFLCIWNGICTDIYIYEGVWAGYPPDKSCNPYGPVGPGDD